MIDWGARRWGRARTNVNKRRRFSTVQHEFLQKRYLRNDSSWNGGGLTNFIELDRSFVPLGKNEEPSLELNPAWGRRIGGWLGWSELLLQHRLVLLAEASSGKTEEFRNQVVQLSASGRDAFYVSIEELADNGFETALDGDAINKFNRWQKVTQEGWFFLDSLDEARLNRKSFELALKKFGKELGESLRSARIFISCRVSDWKGAEDRAFIERLLPAWEASQMPASEESNSLLDPIFARKNDTTTTRSKPVDRKPHELLLVQLVPLSSDQCRKLAEESEVVEADAFMSRIRQNNLDEFTERPGDVLDLIEYWKKHGKFAPLATMVEHSVNHKLSEQDPHRPDNDVLSVKKAREGAERIAAAMTMGKSFVLLSPGYDVDSKFATEAIDPKKVLSDWTPAEQNALLRRGIFAPSTYGRIRFHKRSTQEYLTATWMNRLLLSNCPMADIWNIVFSERYGADAVVPSLKAAAAWLAPLQPEFMREIATRDPIVLLRHGDPSALTLEMRKQMLEVFAEKQSKGEIADDSVDHRALKLFSDRKLAGSIRDVWIGNDHPDFHFFLLRLIREGAVAECADLARSVAHDATAQKYHRSVAIEALAACNDQLGLRRAAQLLIEEPVQTSRDIAATFATVLFPEYLSTRELLSLIRNCAPEQLSSTAGFEYQLFELYLRGDAKTRQEFAAGLAELCLSEPHVDNYHRISKVFATLSGHIEKIALREVQTLGNKKPPIHLLRLLMACERAENSMSSFDDEKGELRRLVRASPRLQCELFWADIEDERARSPEGSQPIRFWNMHFFDRQLWLLSGNDLPWLYDGLGKKSVPDQRVALSAIVSILQSTAELTASHAHLKRCVAGRPLLVEDLDGYFQLRVDDETGRYGARSRERAAKNAAQQEEAKKTWVQFEADLRASPNVLFEPLYVSTWKSGAFRLHDLTRWLEYRTKEPFAMAPRHWCLLTEGFGRAVAEAYRDGLKIVWRHLKPSRPERRVGNAITFKNINLLAYVAIGAEAAENPNWATLLTESEIQLAAMHGCFGERGYPDWMSDLLKVNPTIVIPVIVRAMKHEWTSAFPGEFDVFVQFAQSDKAIHAEIRDALIALVLGKPPGEQGKLEAGLRALANLELNHKQKQKIGRVAGKKVLDYRSEDNFDLGLRYVSLLLHVEPECAPQTLESWISMGKEATHRDRAERTFGLLFGRHHRNATQVIQQFSVPTLESLIRMGYTYVKREDDMVRDGVYTSGARDHAESGRSALLESLLRRTGADAYAALQKLANDPAFVASRIRFLELARRKAEEDCEPPAWTAEETYAFENDHAAPIKTGHDLLKVVIATLNDIQFQFDKGDYSSRALLVRADDEDEVQNWLCEQLNLRARARFTAFRETEVANRDKPDIVISSTSADCQVAIEVKHGGKSWTARQLATSVRKQLVVDYLKPAIRRHGVLVITNHRVRTWKHPETSQWMQFGELVGYLSSVANSIAENDCGFVEVACFGIDAVKKI